MKQKLGIDVDSQVILGACVRDGRPVARQTGALPADALGAWLDANVPART